MGYELYREVLNHAPPNIGTPARLLLAVIADAANDKTREAFPGMPLLSHRTGLGPDAIRKALRRLAEVGLEVRVPMRKDKTGVPVYATNGHRAVYRIPPLAHRSQPGEAVTNVPPLDDATPSEAVTNVPPFAGKGVTFVPQRQDVRHAKAGRSSPPSPHEPSENSSSSARARTRALSNLGATADEEEKIIERVRKTNGSIGNMTAYLAALGRTSDLAALLASVRSEAESAGRLAVIEEAKRHGAPCPHGQPGGAVQHPETQEPLCPLCRRGIAA